MLKFKADAAVTLLQSILLVKNSDNDWQGHAFRLEDLLLEEIEDAIDNLRNMRSQIKNPPRSSKQVFAHMMSSGEFAMKLQTHFKDGVKVYLGRNIDDEDVIREDIRARALERQAERENA